ncbi:MAG TPA: hypothetical protein VJP60_01660 [Rhizomicrobium sp.]|nr:hypothetical protein [Rhizomicrobium sp.]
MPSDQLDLQAIDMYFPETYHRTKRTLLFFCAALIVLLFASAKAKVSVPGLGTDVTIAVASVRILIWTTAAYFGIVYMTEFSNVRRLNAPIIRNTGAAHLDETFEAIAKKFHELATSTEMQLKADRTAIAGNQKMSAQIGPGGLGDGPIPNLARENLPKNIDKMFSEFIASHQAVSPSDLETFREQLRSTVSVQFDNALANSEQIAKAIESANLAQVARCEELTAIMDASKEMRKQAELTRADFKGIASGIGRARRFYFYFLDGAGVGLFFAAATVAAFAPLASSL